jgi:hypothetical protein
VFDVAGRLAAGNRGDQRQGDGTPSQIPEKIPKSKPGPPRHIPAPPRLSGFGDTSDVPAANDQDTTGTGQPSRELPSFPRNAQFRVERL